MNSLEIQTRLAELETTAERASTTAADAATAHEAAVKHAILAGDSAATTKTATALASAQREAATAAEMVERARVLLAEAEASERAEAQAAAKAEIEAGLSKLVLLGRDADAALATYLGLLRRLHGVETEMHRIARQHFRAPWMAPQTLTSGRSAAIWLQGLANGNPPDLKAWTQDIAHAASQNIRGAYDV